MDRIGATHSTASMDATDHRLCRSIDLRPRGTRLVAPVIQEATKRMDRPQHRRGTRFLSGCAERLRGLASESCEERFPASCNQRFATHLHDAARLRCTDATYMVISPEHPLVKSLTTDAQRDAVKSIARLLRSRVIVNEPRETRRRQACSRGLTPSIR